MGGQQSAPPRREEREEREESRARAEEPPAGAQASASASNLPRCNVLHSLDLGEIDEDSDDDMFPFPLEIHEEILHHLPIESLHASRLVSRRWRQVADSESLFRERCRREGCHPRDASRPPSNWRTFYFLCNRRRNLIKNPRAEHGMQNWQILESGGDGWKTEDVMAPHQNAEVQKNFVTSFGMCLKSQLIDLVSEGYDPSFMDEYQPHIKISDWYAARPDCGCEYEIQVDLLRQNKSLIDMFKPDTIYMEQWNDQHWHQITHVFQDYGPGVRYIRFTHGGKDMQFWAGWYGVRLTESSIEICPALNT